MLSYLYLLVSAMAASVGQVLFRKGALVPEVQEAQGPVDTAIAMLFNPTVIVGLVLYAFSTVLWLVGLSKLPLNAAYPFTALTFVFVMIASNLYLGEQIPVVRTIGIGLILGGLALCILVKG